METPFSSCAISTDWKSLYRAAIFEANRRINYQLVAQAEKAVVTRARELFYNHGSLEEKEALSRLPVSSCGHGREAHQTREITAPSRSTGKES